MEYSIYKQNNEKEFNLYGYLGDSVLKPRPFYHTGFEESLENIVLNDVPESEQNFLERTISDKSKTLKATIKALFNEIMLRERLDSFLLYRINDGICRQHSYLENLKEMSRHNYSLELLNDFSSRKLQLEGNVLELEKEKRKEYLECWKDLLFLKKYLLSSLKDYWELNRKIKHLGSLNGNSEKSGLENAE